MSMKDALLAEFDHEMATTRRLLERVPEGELAWKPHERSMTLGQLAGHITNLPFWGRSIVEGTSYDLAAGEAQGVSAPPASREALLRDFDDRVGALRGLLAASGDAELRATWSLTRGGQEIFSMPRVSVLRSFVLNHLIHHRGQLSVYLRLQNVPLPAMYGPTADEA